MFPNFNAWHKVPKDADIPAETPYFMAEGGVLRGYNDSGWSSGYLAEDRVAYYDYYTEEPIPSPEEEAVEKRARAMFYMVEAGPWEYVHEDIQKDWLNLARKYVEKEA